MKLLFESWRQYLKEEQESPHSGLGVVVDFEEKYTIRLALVDLGFIEGELFPEEKPLSIDEFMAKLKDKDLFNKSIIGWIYAGYNPLNAKADPHYGGSSCANTYSVTKSIISTNRRKKGYGTILYNALLGFAAHKKLYLAPDRRKPSAGAQAVWKHIDAKTDDEVSFDDYKNPQTKTRGDDCPVYNPDTFRQNPRLPNDPLDKGYKNQTLTKDYDELKSNLDGFFEKRIKPKFDKPGFFGKLFGQTPKNKVEKLKSQLLRLGKNKFHDWEMKALKNPELR